METGRYILGLLLWVTLPGAIVFWLVIHPFVEFWRKRGALATYLVSFGAMIAVAIIVYWNIQWLMGADLGTHWPLFFLGLVIYVATWFMERRVRRHLKFRTLVGVDELHGEPRKLLDQGVYALVRHPRYLEIILATIGWSMMSNFVGVYVLVLLTIPGLFFVVHLEERELVQRFGDDYVQYQRRVPQIIPTWASFKAARGKTG